jgi:hypothetical protein
MAVTNETTTALETIQRISMPASPYLPIPGRLNVSVRPRCKRRSQDGLRSDVTIQTAAAQGADVAAVAVPLMESVE